MDSTSRFSDDDANAMLQPPQLATNHYPRMSSLTAALSAAANRSRRTQPPPASRLVSLDVFRGFTIAAMILVNNPGSRDAVYAPLRHAAWSGWTFADLVFPFFLFIVGVSLVFSRDRRQAHGASRAVLLGHALWRSLALIAIGLVLNGIFYLPWHEVRLPGVLQRIGVVYFVTMLVTLITTRRMRAVITATLLLGYCALMTLVPVPGHGAGDLSPEGNLASFIDRHLMSGHLWRPGWDPEGVLSTIPAIATALLGTFVAEWLRQFTRRTSIGPEKRNPAARDRGRVVSGLFAVGFLGLITGYWWGRFFPINKSLWTSSFVVFSAGVATLAIAVCYWCIEVKGWRRWGHPFVVFGMNPLVVYAASEIVAMGALSPVRKPILQHWPAFLGNASMGSLVWAVAYVALWWGVAWVMYRKALFVKL